MSVYDSWRRRSNNKLSAIARNYRIKHRRRDSEWIGHWHWQASPGGRWPGANGPHCHSGGRQVPVTSCIASHSIGQDDSIADRQARGQYTGTFRHPTPPPYFNQNQNHPRCMVRVGSFALTQDCDSTLRSVNFIIPLAMRNGKSNMDIRVSFFSFIVKIEKRICMSVLVFVVSG